MFVFWLLTFMCSNCTCFRWDQFKWNGEKYSTPEEMHMRLYTTELMFIPTAVNNVTFSNIFTFFLHHYKPTGVLGTWMHSLITHPGTIWAESKNLAESP